MKNPLMVARAVRSAVKLVRNPDLLDEVFTLADSVADAKVLAGMIAAISEDACAARAFRERPRIGTIDLAALRELPAGTLGRVFADHMIDNGLDPRALPSRDANDPGTYLTAHLFETHDVWHAVTGFGTDVAGELGLQAFYFAQLPSRLSTALVAGGLLNTLFFAFDQRDARMQAIVRGWLLGKRARPFFGVRWNELWATPMDDVRRTLGVDLAAIERELPAPKPPLAA